MSLTQLIPTAWYWCTTNNKVLVKKVREVYILMAVGVKGKKERMIRFDLNQLSFSSQRQKLEL